MTSALSDWPLFGMTDDVRPALAQAVGEGRASVLATLHTVVGGSPRPAGSQMLIVGDQLHGYLSGGCIEADVAAHAEAVLESGAPQRLVYGDGGPFPDIRLVCGGRIELLLERLTPDDAALQRLLTAYAERRPVIWASDGLTRLCIADEGEAHVSDGALGLAAAGLLQDPSALGARVAGGEAIAFRRGPARRMAIVGYDPTALAIASLALQSGFETHLIRPKGPPSPPPLAKLIYHRGEPADTLGELRLDAWTDVAVATHSLDEDEGALLAALASSAAYVGALGARRRLPERLGRLRARGLGDEDLARLHAPIGLDLGGKAPFEIAVSVLAEVMAESNRSRPQAMLDLNQDAEAAA